MTFYHLGKRTNNFYTFLCHICVELRNDTTRVCTTRLSKVQLTTVLIVHNFRHSFKFTQKVITNMHADLDNNESTELMVLKLIKTTTQTATTVGHQRLLRSLTYLGGGGMVSITLLIPVTPLFLWCGNWRYERSLIGAICLTLACEFKFFW